MIDLDEFLEKIGKSAVKWPWISAGNVINGGFLAATIVTTAVSYLSQNSYIFERPAKSKLTTTSEAQASQTFAQGDVKLILDRNLFNIEGKVPSEDSAIAEIKPAYVGDKAIKSNLPLKLHGTIFGGDSSTGIAMIEDTNRKNIDSFVVGQELRDGIKLIEIWRERVILDAGDHKEYLEVERKELAIRHRNKGGGNKKKRSKPRYASTPPPDVYKEEGFERSGSEIKLSSDFRKKLLTSDFAKVLQDAKAEPYFADGELAGFRLNRIRTDSIYEKSGLQNDDIIRDVNGVPLTDVAQSIKLLNSLRSENEIEIRIERGGRTVNMTVQVQ